MVDSSLPRMTLKVSNLIERHILDDSSAILFVGQRNGKTMQCPDRICKIIFFILFYVGLVQSVSLAQFLVFHKDPNILDSQCRQIHHYNGVIMSTMASQITSLTSVYSIVYSRRRWKKTPKLRNTGLCAGNSPVTGEFPAQRSSKAENVFIWWRHHDKNANIRLCSLKSVRDELNIDA